MNEAEIHFQCPTLQENQTKYPTNINGEKYPAFFASAAGWEPLHLCAVGGFPSKFPFLTWLYMRCISTCTTFHSKWLTFGEGYIAVLASPGQFLVIICSLSLLQVQMEVFMGAGGDMFIVKDWEWQHPCGTFKQIGRHFRPDIVFDCTQVDTYK